MTRSGRDGRYMPYAELLGLARRHARRVDEAEDIVQEVLIAALAAGRADWSDAAHRRWMSGAVRRRAAFDARSAARRLARDARYQAADAGSAQPEGEALELILIGLPAGLRVLAALALSGHSRAEISYLLGLNDAALRQRIRSLKKALALKGVALPARTPGLKLDLAYGAIRDSLLPKLIRHGGTLATHDPDGHFLIFATSQNRGRRQRR